MSDDTLTNLLDPTLRPGDKGFPFASAPLRRSEIAAQGWNVLRGDLPFPVAVIRRNALRGNLDWMQRFVSERGLELAPHGKTTMSPQLFQQQLAAGAWGMTVANVAQLHTAAASGARRCIIANQVLDRQDLLAIAQLIRRNSGLQVCFLIDSMRQLELIESHSIEATFDVLLEIGIRGARTGVREVDSAVALAQRIHRSASVRLVGIECYEGLGATGEDDNDRAYLKSVMDDVARVAQTCVEKKWIGADPMIISVGGSAMFDLVADALGQLLPDESRVVRVMRSGCYLTSDDGMYARLGQAMSRRLGCSVGLTSALEVWTTVQSHPERELAILSAGKRDASYDIEMPRPVRWHVPGENASRATPDEWRVSAMNDQHAYLRLNGATAPRIGDRVALGISHPCTTFDKWRWMAVVDDDYNVVDALTTCF